MLPFLDLIQKGYNWLASPFLKFLLQIGQTNTTVYSDGSTQFTSSAKEYLTISHASQTGLNLGTGNFSFNKWIYRDSIGQRVYLSKYQDSNNYWEAGIDASNKHYFKAVIGGSTLISITGTTALSSTATWYNISIVINRANAANCKIYLNGTDDTAAGASTSASTINNTGAVYVGCDGAFTYFTNGRLDSFGVWNRVLSQTEETFLYNSGAGRMASDLTTTNDYVSWWGFNEESGIRYDANRTSKNDLTPASVQLVNATTLNGGFETLGAGGADVFATWSEYVSGTSTVNAESGADKYAGNYSLRFNIDASNSDTYVSSTSILTAGKKYKATFWAKASAGTPTVLAGGSSGYTTVTLSTTYTQYTVYFTANNAYFFLERGSAASKSLYIDNVTLESVSVDSAAGIASGLSIDGNLCASFTGASQSLTKTDTATLRSGGGDFSIFGWVNLAATRAGTQLMVYKYNSGANKREYALASTATTFSFIASADGTTPVQATVSMVPLPNKWYFMIGEFNSATGKSKLTVNETEGSESSIASILQEDSTFTIAVASTFGRVDGVGIIRRLLTASEKTALFNSGKGVKYAGLPSTISSDTALKGFWNLDMYSAGTEFVTRLDSTSNANDLTDTGNTPSGQGVDYFEGTISKWLDSSVNGYNFIQPTQSSRLLYRTNQLNGYPVATGDGLTKTAYYLADLMGTGDITTIVFVRPRGYGGGATGGSRGHILYSNGSSYRFFIADSYSGVTNGFVFTRDGATNAISDSNVITLNTAYILIVTSTAAGVTNFYINGVLSGTANQSAGTPAAGTATYFMNRSAGDRGFDGDCTSPAILNTILTPSQIQTVTTQLRTKYGV